MNSYSSYFFQLAGNKDPFRVTLILACVQMASILLVSLYTDVGRRWPTVIGYGIASLSVLSIGIIGTQDYTSPSLGSLLVRLVEPPRPLSQSLTAPYISLDLFCMLDHLLQHRIW